VDDHDKTEVTARIARQVESSPLLADFHIPFPKLTDAGRPDSDAAFARLGELLGAVQEPLTVRFRVTDEGSGRSWLFDGGPDGCRVTNDAATQPDVEVILDAETWNLIASGAMSPLEAFGRGRLRIRGDINLARRFVQQVHRASTPHS
jgi:hypothetical protein